MMQVEAFMRRSHTLTKAAEAVKARRVDGQYLTTLTLFGCPASVCTSSLRQRSQTLTVRSLDAVSSSSSVASTERTALLWPSATLEQMSGARGAIRPWYGWMEPFPGKLEDSPMRVPATRRWKTFLPDSSLVLPTRRKAGGDPGGEAEPPSSFSLAAELNFLMGLPGMEDGSGCCLLPKSGEGW